MPASFGRPRRPRSTGVPRHGGHSGRRPYGRRYVRTSRKGDPYALLARHTARALWLAGPPAAAPRPGDGVPHVPGGLGPSAGHLGWQGLATSSGPATGAGVRTGATVALRRMGMTRIPITVGFCAPATAIGRTKLYWLMQGTKTTVAVDMSTRDISRHRHLLGERLRGGRTPDAVFEAL